MPEKVKLAEYLFTRLRQLGVESIFGVPGDFNLQLLDYVKPAGIHWVGTCNELNAGYAADAYSRVKGLSAMITTFGVGELSAINAVAGANAELAPLVHIVGSPSRALQDSRASVHHTLLDGDFGRFAEMHKFVTIAQASLKDPRTAPAMIDDVLKQCLLYSRPVYIEVPIDMVSSRISVANLEKTISIPMSIDNDTAKKALSAILERVRASKKPLILVDGEVRAYRAIQETQDFINETKWPTFTSSFGRGYLDETVPNWHGVYKGVMNSAQKDFVDSSDLVFSFGPHHSTTNSYGLTAISKPEVTVSFKATSVQVGKTLFRDLPAKSFIALLLQRLKEEKLPAPVPFTAIKEGTVSTASPPSTEQIKSDNLASVLSKFIQSGDTVLAETGTAGFVARDFVLPKSTGYFSHSTWLSIGYMLPATLGAAVAKRELARANGTTEGRTILLIGDGSLQMTVQEISTMIKENLPIIIFVVNNKGYLIERCIHGWNQTYNDVVNWNYLEAPTFFGAAKGQCATFKVTTNGELKGALEDERLISGKGLKMVELLTHPDDAPEGLWKMLEYQTGKPRTETMKT